MLSEIEHVGIGNKEDYKNDLDDLVRVRTIYFGGGTPSYIDSKGIGAKHVTSLPKEDITKKGYAILLVKKKSKMNTLNENHAMFVMSARYDGVMVYDPSRTTQAFYSWIDIIKCC